MTSESVQHPGDMDDDNLMPVIDLSNFEEPVYEDSRYVLTSPRSLEACARLGIKPVELVHKLLSDLQEELLPQDVPLRTIYGLYEETESNRQRRLKLCRELRHDLVLDENKVANPSNKKSSSSSGDRQSASKMNKKSKKSSTLSDDRKNADHILNSINLQHERTKRALSFGHEHLTAHEIHSKAEQLMAESKKIGRDMMSKENVHKQINSKEMKRPASAVNNEMLDIQPSIVSPDITQRLPVKDRKILALMAKRAKEEDSLSKTQFQAQLSWEDEKRQIDEIKLAAENSRRKSIMTQRQVDVHKQTLKAKERQLIENVDKEVKQVKIEKSVSKHQLALIRQHRMRDQKISEHLEKEKKKKYFQEETKTALEDAFEEVKLALLDKKRGSLKKATNKKYDQLAVDTLARKLLNTQKQREHEQRRDFLDKTNRSDMKFVRMSTDQRHTHTQSNYAQVLKTREQALSLAQNEREEKQKKAHLVQKRLDAELEVWRENLQEHRKQAEEHASKLLSQTVEEKAVRAHEQRVVREREHKKNIQRVMEEVEAWKLSTQASIKQKELKGDAVIQDKHAAMERSRATAHLTQKLREKLREHFHGNTFDKMAFKAEQYPQMGGGKTAGYKNTSTFQLGYMKD